MKKTLLLMFMAMLVFSLVKSQESSIPDTTKAEKKDHVGGPSSVTSQLKADAEQRKSNGIKQADEWLKSKLGLNLGADYNITSQMISKSPATTSAASGVLRFYGRWSPITKNENFTGQLVFKIESRHLLGTELTPQMLAPNAGYAGISAATFSNVKFWFSNFYWTQSFWKNRFAFNLGVVDVTDYLNVYGLINIWTDFNNLNFATDASINPPNMGLGGVIRVMFTPNYYLIAGMADLNGDPHRPGEFFSSFGDGEYFKHAEIGRISSWGERYSNNIHLTFWQADKREAAGIDDGWGLAFSFSQAFGKQWTTFLRAGYSEGAGTFLNKSVSTGAGYQLKSRNDYFGLGFNWGRPPKDVVEGQTKDQYTFETYYRVQFLPQVSLWPSFQWYINPAYLPEKDKLWMLSLRLRAAL